MPHNENWSRSQAVFHHAPKTYISLQSFQCADNWATMCTCIILIQPMHLLRRVYWAWNMYHSVYFVFLIITFSRFIFIDSSILYSVFFKNCIVLHCIDTICICRGILGVKYVLHSLYYNLYSPSCNCSKGRLSAMQGILANLRLTNLVIGLIIIIILQSFVSVPILNAIPIQKSMLSQSLYKKSLSGNDHWEENLSDIARLGWCSSRRK